MKLRPPARRPQWAVRPICGSEGLSELARDLHEQLQRLLLVPLVLLEQPGSLVVPELPRQPDQRLVDRELQVLGANPAAGVEEVAQLRLLHVRRLLVMLLQRALERRAPCRGGLGAHAQARLLDSLDVPPRLLQVLGERLPQLLVVRLVAQLRQRLELEDALDPEQLCELEDKEVARVAQLRDAGSFRRSSRVRRAEASASAAPPCPRRLSASSPASRSERAMITSAGLAEPSVGKTLPSATSRFGTSHARCDESTTESRALKPILQPPTRCAYRSIFSRSCAPAPSQISSMIFVA